VKFVDFPPADYFVKVPDTLKSVSFIDTKRFPDTGGRAYARFLYDPASGTFTPDGGDANAGTRAIRPWRQEVNC
jgi:hypothetical protein